MNLSSHLNDPSRISVFKRVLIILLKVVDTKICREPCKGWFFNRFSVTQSKTGRFEAPSWWLFCHKLGKFQSYHPPVDDNDVSTSDFVPKWLFYFFFKKNNNWDSTIHCYPKHNVPYRFIKVFINACVDRDTELLWFSGKLGFMEETRPSNYTNN